MTRDYNPPRRKAPVETGDPLEVELVYNVRSCGTCSFFWPDDPTDQPYGPFPTFDFTVDTPSAEPLKGHPKSYPWLKVLTREESFPNGEIMDGCRKAPIMTIGINPNLTAFSPGVTGTSWAYPGFTSDDGTDAWTKYAYYYRYRSVYQERFDFEVIKKYLVPGSEKKVTKAGKIVSADRTSSAPSFNVDVEYDDGTKETFELKRDLGEPRYVLLFNRESPGNEFAAGDAIAAQLNVPAGKDLTVYQALQTYYEQFVPSLSAFETFLHQQGHEKASLRMGEDVCQLDMVACASPHWKPSYLGGSSTSEANIIDNCVSRNAWAIKQLVQTRPAILYLVGESSYSMFRHAFGALIKRDPPLSEHPYDGAFTLFSETTDPKRPCTFEFSTSIDDRSYSLSTRLVVTPHFSYDTNFLPQIRVSKKTLANLEKDFPGCVKFLRNDSRIEFNSPSWGFDAFLFKTNGSEIVAELEKQFPDAWKQLRRDFYDPHQMMAGVMEELYQSGKLAYHEGKGSERGYLDRTEGACQFCINSHWTFPLGCPYEKNLEPSPPADFLAKVAAQIVAEGKRQTIVSGEKKHLVTT